MSKRMYRFTVQGEPCACSVGGHILPFPDDMLRYDRCEVETKQDDGTVTLVGPFKPTVGRWESFGWNVINCEEKS